eukprot:c18569_g1_i1 orf=62-370(+)
MATTMQSRPPICRYELTEDGNFSAEKESDDVEREHFLYVGVNPTQLCPPSSSASTSSSSSWQGVLVEPGCTSRRFFYSCSLGICAPRTDQCSAVTTVDGVGM